MQSLEMKIKIALVYIFLIPVHGEILHSSGWISENSAYTVTCVSGYYIYINSVWYGHTSGTSCYDRDAFNQIQSQCQGKNYCLVHFSSSFFGDPCPGQSKRGYVRWYCARDGGWSNWGSWSTCSLTCGSGTKYRTRSCNNPTHVAPGKDCSGTTRETSTCTTGPCPSGPGLVKLVPTTTSYTLVENTDTLGPITCTADCRPGCTYQWRRGSTNVNTGAVLRIHGIDRRQAGTYTCTATNKQDAKAKVSSDVIVVVEYAPINTQLAISAESDVPEMSTVTFTCTTDSVPLSTIQLIHFGNSTDVLHTWYGVEKGTFTRLRSSCIDTGEYACRASNSRGISQSVLKRFNVLCKPRLLNIGNNSETLVVHEGDPLNIDVAFVAYPAPSFTWTFLREDNCRDPSVLQNSTNVHILNSLDDQVVYFSKIQYTNMRQQNDGRYLLRVENRIGKADYLIFTVAVVGKPDPPTGIKAVCSKNKAEVIWQSAYNGGNSQHFVIGVKSNIKSQYKKGSRSYKDPGIQSVITGLVDGLDEDKHYWFTIYAINAYGTSKSAPGLECDTPADNGPNTATVAMLVVAILLFVGGGLGVIGFFVIKRRRKAKEGNQMQSIAKAENKCPSASYEDLGVRDQPTTSYYQEIGLSDNVTQNSSRESSNEYDNSGQRNAPHPYENVNNPQSLGNIYENTYIQS